MSALYVGLFLITTTTIFLTVYAYLRTISLYGTARKTAKGKK